MQHSRSYTVDLIEGTLNLPVTADIELPSDIDGDGRVALDAPSGLLLNGGPTTVQPRYTTADHSPGIGGVRAIKEEAEGGKAPHVFGIPAQDIELRRPLCEHRRRFDPF
jgi:hypothetical protein